jgi:protein-L-isoaspartate(D-aspartate) O-methyltransferase
MAGPSNLRLDAGPNACHFLQPRGKELEPMDFALARANMIESQVRPNGVTDERIILAMAAVPREYFVPPSRRSLAYMDEAIELTHDRGVQPRYLMEPMTFARLLQLLALGPGDSVLDVGCATGYSTAILANMAGRVVALESDAELAREADSNLAHLGLANARVVTGTLSKGWLAEAPFDAILVNGRIPAAPLELLAQLKDPGRLAAVVGENDVSQGALFTRNGAFSVRSAFDAAVSRLPDFEPVRPPFEF